MILSDRDIRKLIKSGQIKVSPAPDLKVQLQPASLDIRLSSRFRVFKPASTPYIDPQDKGTFANLTTGLDVTDDVKEQPLLPHLPKGPRAFVIHPGEFVLGSTLEHIELPDDIAVRIDGRSSLGRLGIVVHSTAGHVSPGWKGTLTLEITNIGVVPVLLYPGMRVCQFVFETMSSPVERAYGQAGNKYAGQRSPDASKITDETGRDSDRKKTVKKNLKKLSAKATARKSAVR
ncbi:MAG: dCTP deaminase [Patescibacteria group bacterium]